MPIHDRWLQLDADGAEQHTVGWLKDTFQQQLYSVEGRTTHFGNNSCFYQSPFSHELSILPLSLSLFLKLQTCPFNYFECLLCIIPGKLLSPRKIPLPSFSIPHLVLSGGFSLSWYTFLANESTFQNFSLCLYRIEAVRLNLFWSPVLTIYQVPP